MKDFVKRKMKLDNAHHNVGLDGLRVQGEAAPKNQGGVAPLSATLRVNKPSNHISAGDRTYPFVLNKTNETNDVTVSSLNGPTTVPVRKMEHLSRVKTANFGITTMDSPFAVNDEPETAFIIDKPHFVLCGLPVSGSKEIDHHLYVSEARVGNFKTSARALYRARRGHKPTLAFSDPAYIQPDKELINYNTNLNETVDESGKKSVPPIPPTTPVNYAHHLASLKPKTAIGLRSVDDSGQRFHGSIPSGESEHKYIPSELLIKHRKMTLLRRDQTNGSIELHREHSSVSTRSGKSVETVTESVVTNSLTITTGKGAKIVTRSLSKSAKVNYNNPYRNTKFKERLALNGHKRIEFNSLDSYLKYQKQQHHNGKHILTPRAVLRVPKPCSDTFLLQMIHELNRPRTRKSSGKYSDVAITKDLEEFVQTRTSSSLSKTQSNIDKFLGKSSEKSSKSAKSAKSGKSTRSAKSAVDAEAIEEEEDWEDDIIPAAEDNKA